VVINDELTTTLRQVGLTEKEAVVYVALLSLETGTAYQIAQQCEVKKPTVYVILEDLRKKGLVLKIPHAKKALFSASDLGGYLREQENRLKTAQSIIPKLHALGSGPPSSVYFFNGLNGFIQALGFKFETMRGKTYHSFYSVLAGGSKEIKEAYSKWDRKAVAADVGFKIIMAKEGGGKYYKDIFDLAKAGEDIEIRLLEKYDYPPTTTIEIAEDFIRILDETREQATIIDNKQTADAMRQIFQVVWEKGV